MTYEEMNVQQRAEYLLAKGVTAKLGFDRDAMEPGYYAQVDDMGQLPCGYHKSAAAAIESGTAWLRQKAVAG